MTLGESGRAVPPKRLAEAGRVDTDEIQAGGLGAREGRSGLTADQRGVEGSRSPVGGDRDGQADGRDSGVSEIDGVAADGGLGGGARGRVAWWVWVGRGVRVAWRYEVRLWADLIRWVGRRPVSAREGDTLFPYVGAVRMMLWILIGLSAVEVPIVHLIVWRWATVRDVVLGLGIYGLVWMIGLWAMMTRNPHAIGPLGLRIRNGPGVDVPIPWEAVEAVRVRRRSLPPEGQTQVEEVGDARILSIGVGSQTSVDVVLREPLVVGVSKTRGLPVTQIRFHADDPDGLVRVAHEQLARGGNVPA